MIDLSAYPYNAVLDGFTDISAPLQAAIDDLVPKRGGKIVIPGLGALMSPVVVGDRTGNTFTSISIEGEGQLASSVKFMGTGTALKWWRNKYSGMKHIALTNGGSRGGIGIQATGPAAGTQSNGLTFENLGISNFDVGFQAGGGPLGTECASEIRFDLTSFQQNNTGYLGAGSGNTINVWFDKCAFTQNSLYGANLGTSQMVTFRGGDTNGNGVASIKQVGQWQTQLLIEGMRFELGPNEFLADLGAPDGVTVSHCVVVTTGAVPTYAVINGAPGPKTLRLINNTFGSIGQSGWIPYGGLVQQGPSKYLEATGNTVYGMDILKIPATDTGMNGMKYEFRGNTYNGVSHGVERGVVVWPNRVNT